MNLEEYFEDPEAIIDLSDENTIRLCFVIQELSKYPFLGEKFIEAGLRSKNIMPRKLTLNTIKLWKDITEFDIEKFPINIYKALLELKEKEMIKEYKIQINDILNISEDLTDYVEPKIQWLVKDIGINIDIYSDELDDLFEEQIRYRGKDYYLKEMVYSCIKSDNEYIAFVQGTDFGKEYQVNITMNYDNKIQKIDCNCPYSKNCKHEYATILYLRNMKKK